MLKAPFILLAYWMCCSFSFSLHAQDADNDSTRFSLRLSYYNHAELVYKGAVSYSLTDDYVGISRRNLFDKTDIPVYSANIRRSVSDSILALKLDQLELFYSNSCVMPTSGDEYFISIRVAGKEQRIYLHHYYHPRIARLISILNNAVPEEYRITYLGKEIRQDCR